MKKMFRMGSRLLAFVLAMLLFSVTAFADLIYEPNDDFFERHREDCEYENAAYETCGPNGGVIVYASPIKNKEVMYYKNGEHIYISYVYTDRNSVRWGITEKYDHGKWSSGWLPMDYVWECYSSSMFMQDYAASITSEDFTVNEDGTAEKVLFWSYPGSTEYQEYGADENFQPCGNKVFTDEQGRKWGYLGYWMGSRSVWVLIDDPGAEFDSIYPDGAPERDLRTPPSGDLEEIVPGGKKDKDKDKDKDKEKDEEQDKKEEKDKQPVTREENRMLLICAAAVALVVAVTAVLLIVLKKKKASGGETE